DGGMDKELFSLEDISLISLNRGSFDVIVGMDWLSKRKFGVVFYEKVVRIHLVPEATSVTKSRYRLAPLEMQELSEPLSRLQEQRHKPLEFEVRDRVLLKVTPWKGIVCFGKKGKLAPRLVKPLVLTCESVAIYGVCDFMCLYAFMWIMWEIGSQSIECDHLNEMGMVVRLVEFISFTLGDKEMILVI
ncbi:hypothetical protein Tco_0690235, partial [Tanacetum coccineum]